MWNDELGTIKATEQSIDLEPETRPMRSKPYRQGPAMQEHTKIEIEKMLAAGVIEPATSKCASPVVSVPRNCIGRLCVKYRELNTKTLSDTYWLPPERRLLRLLGRRFRLLDAGLQLRLVAYSGCRTGQRQGHVYYAPRHVVVHTDAFRPQKRPCHLPTCSRHHLFGRSMAGVSYLSGRRYRFLKTVAKLVDRLDTVLTLLRDSGISLKLKKCFFFQLRVNYPGHVVEPGCLSLARQTTETYQTSSFRLMLTHLRSFLGACNVYQRFLNDFSKIALLFTDATRKDVSLDFKSRTTAQQQTLTFLNSG